MMKAGYYNCAECHSEYHKECVNLKTKNMDKFENLSRKEMEELDKIRLPNSDSKRIPLKKACGKKCLSYAVQEILEFTESPAFRKIANKTGMVTSTCFYLASPIISTWVAWRFYWQYGEYYSTEHFVLAVVTAHL